MSKLAKVWGIALLLASGVVAQVGCRACGSCYDYSSPVANCECGCCNCPEGTRAGSACSMGCQQGCPTGDCYTENEGGALDQPVGLAKQPQERSTRILK
ncbi:MAG: hypothetical protein KDA37_09635 [Planctomycetales bacterium]|nr:hypothetical protein [Planctomycetales bacterium]